ncbi:glycosyltransferase family 4 protein [uncultured Methanomethylovorans sp.]|uniref:glycosyltransferase family 4 protein n=1 Tax=uncultured Methanomethylovorans sp. TaxID=183759 RepID=UPI0026169108|nr:glycosyltransferase family 4 protein [uncultured Methanomethylovorans sp.]
MWIAGLLYFVSVYSSIHSNKFKFDLIHSHFAYPDGFSSILLGKVFRKPVVITVHGSDINLYTHKMDYLKPLVIYALKNATHIIAVSTALKNRIVELGISEDKISVIHNGYNPELFKPMDKNEIRKSLELPFNKKIVLFVGNLIPAKGVTYLIEAMEIISTIRNDVILLIVGDGYLRPKLEKMVQQQRLCNQIIFVGRQPYEKIPLWMNSSDLLVLPSISEGFGAVLIEAAACGKPIVATNVGGIPEASLESFRRLVPPKDPNSLALSILDILGSNFNSNEIIKENRKFSMSNITNQLLDVYNNLEK